MDASGWGELFSGHHNKTMELAASQKARSGTRGVKGEPDIIIVFVERTGPFVIECIEWLTAAMKATSELGECGVAVRVRMKQKKGRSSYDLVTATRT